VKLDLKDLFTPISNFSWRLAAVVATPVGIPKDNRCSLFCLCGYPATMKDDAIICGNQEADCDFYIPGYKAFLYYVEHVLAKIFQIHLPIREFIRQKQVLWLQPVCECGMKMKLGIWQSRIREDELYWNAMCKHRECKHTFVSGKVILPRMCDYFDKNPAFKADCMKYVQ